MNAGFHATMRDKTTASTPAPGRKERPVDGQPERDPHAVLRVAAIEHHKKENFSQSAALYAKYLNRCPNDASVWSNLGVLMRQTGRRAQALRFQQRAYGIDPSLRIVRNNLANSLGDLGRNAEAAALYRGLLDERPQDSEAVWNLGRSLRALGAYEDAIEVLQAGRRRHPNKAQIRLQLALTQLAAGVYAEGFDNYDARFDTGDVPRPKIDLPRWDGTPLAGKSLLVLHEQGLGDSLLCARFLPALKAQAKSVHLVCRPQVRRLLAHSALADTIGERVPDLSGIDVWASMFDLPRYHFAGGGGIPGPARFTPPPDSVQRAEALMAPHAGRLRVGVVWSGSVTYRANHVRSFGHEALLPLADIDGVQLFSLYKGPLQKEFLADASNALLMDVASSDADLADCAATILCLDLVITADTAVAHLAASLGIDVWCLLHWDPFWLYGHHEDRSAWYPTMRLYRQRRPMDWDEVMARVHADLERRAQGRAN